MARLSLGKFLAFFQNLGVAEVIVIGLQDFDHRQPGRGQFVTGFFNCFAEFHRTFFS